MDINGACWVSAEYAAADFINIRKIHFNNFFAEEKIFANHSFVVYSNFERELLVGLNIVFIEQNDEYQIKYHKKNEIPML